MADLPTEVLITVGVAIGTFASNWLARRKSPKDLIRRMDEQDDQLSAIREEARLAREHAESANRKAKRIEDRGLISPSPVPEPRTEVGIPIPKGLKP